MSVFNFHILRFYISFYLWKTSLLKKLYLQGNIIKCLISESYFYMEHFISIKLTQGDDRSEKSENFINLKK